MALAAGAVVGGPEGCGGGYGASARGASLARHPAPPTSPPPAQRPRTNGCCTKPAQQCCCDLIAGGTHRLLSELLRAAETDELESRGSMHVLWPAEADSGSPDAGGSPDTQSLWAGDDTPVWISEASDSAAAASLNAELQREVRRAKV